MAPISCPRCGMIIDTGEETCPFCRAARRDGDPEEGPRSASEDELHLKRRPKIAVGWLAAALLLPAAWVYRGLATTPLLAAWSEFTAEVEKARTPVLAAEAAPIPPVILTPSAPAEPAFLPPETPLPAPPPRDVERAPAPSPERAVRIWYGMVYDVMTLKPIADARLLYRIDDERGDFTSVRTDTAGHYQIRLDGSADNRLSVTIEPTPGYREGLREDRDPPLRDSPLSIRRSFAEETSPSDLEPVPLRCRPDAEIVELNLILVPAAKH